MSDVKLVKMVKDGVYLEVHPTCVEAHIKEAGWSVVGAEELKDESKKIRAGDQPFVVRDTEP